MNKITFVYMLIEALVFLVPVATLFIKVGKLIGIKFGRETRPVNLTVKVWKRTT